MNASRQNRLYTGYRHYSKLKRLDWIVSRIEAHRGSRQAQSLSILDIGCGRGNISLPLASLGYRVHGIDVDPDEVSWVAARNTFPNASFEAGDAGKIDFKTQWDIVICSAIFEHLFSPENLFRKLPEIVKRDGIILITIPNGYGPYELFDEVPMRLLSKVYHNFLRRRDISASPHVHKQNFTFKAFTALMNDCGIYIEKVGHSNFMSFWPVIRRFNFLARIDCKLADLLPHSFVSGWFFLCKLK